MNNTTRLTRRVNFLLSTLCIMALTTSAFSKAPTKTYAILFDDGGEHPVKHCDTTSTALKKIKKIKTLSHIPGYLGSLQIEFSQKNEAGIDAYQHFFSTLNNCNHAIKIIKKQNGF